MNRPIVQKAEGRRLPAAYWYLFACFAASLLFLLFQGGKLASMLFMIVALLSVYLLLGHWSGIKRTQAVRTLEKMDGESPLEAGQSLQVKLRLQIPGIWPIPYVLVKDRLLRQQGEEIVLEGSFVPDWGRRGELVYSTPPLKRGFYQFGTTACMTEDVFGLFQHRGQLELPQQLVVHPETVDIAAWSSFHRLLNGMQHHSATTRAHRETTQVNGVREYVYGDRLSKIHWNATAKTGTWKSKEFERESLPKTIVLLDRTHRAYTDPAAFELAVSITASLFRYSAAKGLSLGLLSVGAKSACYEPKMSQHHHKLVMNHLVDVEADGFRPLAAILKDRLHEFTRGSLLVVVSPQHDSSMMRTLDWARQHQMNPCHIWVKTESASPLGRPAEHAEGWLKQLRARGYLGYAVTHLAELSDRLGGEKTHV